MNSAHIFAQPYFFAAKLLKVKAEFNIFAPAFVICIEWMTSEIISSYELQSTCDCGYWAWLNEWQIVSVCASVEQVIWRVANIKVNARMS